MFLPPDDEGYLILHNQDPAEWAKRHDLRLDLGEHAKCYNCNTPRVPTLPIVLGKLRGMVSEYCACGYKSRAPYVLKMTGVNPLDTDDLKKWEAETDKAWEVWRRKEKERKRIAYNAKRREARAQARARAS